MEITQDEIKEKLVEVLDGNTAIILATTGGEFSPWILGAYYTTKEMSIYLLLETNGKSLANIKLDSKVAFSVSKNDATQDFIQGQGNAVILPDEDEANVREMLVQKMPWYKTFVPMTPIRINIKQVFVTSLQKGWFPAKVFSNN
jgi:nitroimidazol reductase NimA-like FMN-containing flavoprotein (pyridoxamine 5'-phosphate oxidase superfamily)